MYVRIKKLLLIFLIIISINIMGIYDSIHIFHENADEYHKKDENIDMRKKNISNLNTM